jgi:predicted HTH domain antitoxin
MEITFDIPNSSRAPRRESRYYKEALVSMLYQAGDLSSKEACEALGVSRRAFEEILARFRVSVMPDDDDSIAAELSA